MSKHNFTNKDVRVKEFLNHINTYGTIDGMTNVNYKLYQSIIHYEKSLLSLVNELGLQWEDISNSIPTNYYKDFDNLQNKINKFIKQHGRFPKKLEMTNE